MCGEFDYVYYLFHDESKDRRIKMSIDDKEESLILERMWTEFNVKIKFV